MRTMPGVAMVATAAALSSGTGTGPAVDKAPEPSTGDYSRQIQQLEDECLHATLVGDATFGERYFADDYVQISLGGAESGRQFQIDIEKTGSIKYEQLDLKRSKIRVYGETAVVNMESLAAYTIGRAHV